MAPERPLPHLTRGQGGRILKRKFMLKRLKRLLREEWRWRKRLRDNVKVRIRHAANLIHAAD